MLTEKTSARGAVVAVGEPRLQLSESSFGALQVRADARRVFAVDRDEVKVWELDTGRLVQRIVPPDADDGRLNLAVSRDGQRLAMGYYSKLHVLTAPFNGVAFTVPRASPKMFSPDGELLVTTSSTTVSLIALAQRRVVATSPAPSNTSIATFTAATSGVGKHVYWVRDLDVLRWIPASGTLEVVHTAPVKLAAGRIASRAAVALLSDGAALYRLDLETGAMVRVGPFSTLFFAVSESGERVAVHDRRVVRVLESRTGKELASVKLQGGLRRIAYDENEGVVAYLEGNVIRVLDVQKGVRQYEAPSRFAGWLDGGAAAIERAGAFARIALPTVAATPITAAVLTAGAPARPSGAPAWATWLTAGPGGTLIAAEPSERRGLPPERRYEVKCPARLRVWTAVGGTRTFALKPTDEKRAQGHEDPCWEIAGGRVVGVTTKQVTIYEPTTGKKVAELDVGRPPSAKLELEHEYWAVAVSPTGRHLALWWRRADVWAPPQPADPRRDVMHNWKDPDDIECEMDRVGDCKLEYFAEVWSLEGTPRRLWQTRFDSRQSTTRTWPLPKIASGPIAFTPDGNHVLLGFDDGDIVVRSVTDASATRTERLHRAPITRLEVAPGGGWVFSEDGAGEQRLWQMMTP